MSIDNEALKGRVDKEVPDYFSEKDFDIHTRYLLNYKEGRAVIRIANQCHEVEGTSNGSPDERLPNPGYSGFYVEGRMGIVEHPEISVPLFNLEHGEGDALHGEEVGGSLLRAIVGPSLPQKRVVMGFPGEGTPVSCGGCLDFMRENFSPRSLTIVADSKNHKIGIWRLQDHFFPIDDSLKVIKNKLPRQIAQIVDELTPDDFDRGGYWPYHNSEVHPERHYSAMMFVGNRFFKEGGYGPVDYRTTPAVQMLMQQIMPAEKFAYLTELHSPGDVADFCLYILGSYRGVVPDVVYKDRNQLLELEHRLSKMWGKPDLAIPVAIVNYNKKGNKEIRFTNSKEWLPDPFHPRILSG